MGKPEPDENRQKVSDRFDYWSLSWTVVAGIVAVAVFYLINLWT